MKGSIEFRSREEEISIPTKVFLSLGAFGFCLVFVLALAGV